MGWGGTGLRGGEKPETNESWVIFQKQPALLSILNHPILLGYNDRSLGLGVLEVLHVHYLVSSLLD